MQGKYFATFGSVHLQDYNIPGGAMRVMLVSPAGLTDEEFRAILAIRFDEKYCTTYPIAEAARMHKAYDMVMYTLEDLEDLKDLEERRV